MTVIKHLITFWKSIAHKSWYAVKQTKPIQDWILINFMPLEFLKSSIVVVNNIIFQIITLRIQFLLDVRYL